MVDGRVMADAYVFTPGGTDSYPWVTVIPPGEYEAEVYREGYVSAFGEASRGRLPMVVGGFVPSFGPKGDYFYDQRLVLATLPDAGRLRLRLLLHTTRSLQPSSTQAKFLWMSYVSRRALPLASLHGRRMDGTSHSLRR